MPLEGTPLSADEKNKILEWIRAGSPNERGISHGDLALGFVTENDKYLCIEKDLKTVPAEDRPYQRYFSLTHLYNAGRELGESQVAIARLLNSLSFNGKLTNPKKVDAMGSLLRIDLRDFDLNDAKWNLILAKNPYGVTFDSKPAKSVYGYTKTNFPDVRGDWFVFSASKPPLYHDLLGLSGKIGKDKDGNVEVLEADRDFFNRPGDTRTKNGLPLRVIADFDLTHHPKEHFSVGLRKSGVSNHNRSFSRVPLVDPNNKDILDPKRVKGYLYISEDFDSDQDKSNIFEHPTDFEKKGGEYIASVEKIDDKGEKMNAQIYLLANAKGKRLDEVAAGLDIVAHDGRRRHANAITNGISCMDCHERQATGIINPKLNQLADHLRDNPELFRDKNVPLATIAQFKKQKELEPIYEKDQKSYAKFLNATGGIPGAIYKTSDRFEDDLNERQVASELGMTVEDFRHEVERNPELKKRLALNATGSIPRPTFLKEFKDVAALLSLGGKVDVSHEAPKEKNGTEEKVKKRALLAGLSPENMWAEKMTTETFNEEGFLRAKEFCAKQGARLPDENDVEELKEIARTQEGRDLLEKAGLPGQFAGKGAIMVDRNGNRAAFSIPDRAFLSFHPDLGVQTINVRCLRPRITATNVSGDYSDLNFNKHFDFVGIAPGEFLMGSDPTKEPERDSDETQHKVKITKPYAIGKFEVTQGLWEKVMGSNPSKFKGANRPVDSVSWKDITDKPNGFLSRLNSLRKSQGDPCTYRLPTDAEWEFAARSGTDTKYSFGNNENQLDNFAWFNPKSGKKTHDVDDATKKANPKGIQGMYGNVWEWCQDTYQENLGTSLQTDPKIGVDNDDGSSRVLRGGSWFNDAHTLRSADRSSGRSGFKSDGWGLRLVRQCQ